VTYPYFIAEQWYHANSPPYPWELYFFTFRSGEWEQILIDSEADGGSSISQGSVAKNGNELIVRFRVKTGDIRFYRSLDNGTTWVQEEAFPSGVPLRRMFNVDGTWLAYDTYNTWYASGDGLTWEELPIPPDAAGNEWSWAQGGVFIDEQGRIHWVTAQDNPGIDGYDIWYRQSTDLARTWTGAKVIFSRPSRFGYGLYTKPVVTARGDFIAVADGFEDLDPGPRVRIALLHAVSRDGGETFESGEIYVEAEGSYMYSWSDYGISLALIDNNLYASINTQYYLTEYLYPYNRNIYYLAQGAVASSGPLLFVHNGEAPRTGSITALGDREGTEFVLWQDAVMEEEMLVDPYTGLPMPRYVWPVQEGYAINDVMLWRTGGGEVPSWHALRMENLQGGWDYEAAGGYSVWW